MKKKLTRFDLQQMKEQNRKAVWMTAYDYTTAQLAEESGMDMLLVGDSLGMAVYGYPGTVPVTMDQCIYHTEAVRRAAPNTFVIGDMPFESYQAGVADACRNAIRFHKEAGVDCIKLEGGTRVAPVIRAISDGGMLVMGHVGLTPQSSGAMGGFRAQGRTAESAKAIIEDAKALEAAGVFSIILEAVPAPLGKLVAESVSVPVIGIGAGADVDGQVLVTHDMVGLFDKFMPKFVKQYTQIRPIILEALGEYKKEVQAAAFPAPEHSFKMSDEVLAQLKSELKS